MKVAGVVIGITLVIFGFLALDNVGQREVGPVPATVLDKSYTPGYTSCSTNSKGVSDCTYHPPTYKVLVLINDKHTWGFVSSGLYDQLALGDPVDVWWHSGRLTHWTYADTFTLVPVSFPVEVGK